VDPPLVLRSPPGEKVPGLRTVHGFLLVRCPFRNTPSLRPSQGVFQRAVLLAVVGRLAEAPLALEEVVRVVACHAARVLLVLKEQ